MYDRSTDSLWQQFRGEPVVGRLAESGLKLEVLPVVVTTWGQWAADHPDTTVLDINTGVYPESLYSPEDDPRSVYHAYRAQSDTMFSVWQRSGALPVKAQVLGLELGGETKAYPLEFLRDRPVLNDVLGGQTVVVVTVEGGLGSRAYARNNHRFVEARVGEDDSLVLVDNNGGTWRLEEDALVSLMDQDQRLPRLPSRVAYWFGWYAFNPGTEVFSPE